MIHHGSLQYNAIYMNNAIRTMRWPEDWPPYNGQRQVEYFGEMSVPFRFESQCVVIVQPFVGSAHVSINFNQTFVRSVSVR